MVFLLLQYSMSLFIILSLLSFSKSSPLFPSLLSLNCTPPSQSSVLINKKSIKILIDNLTSRITTTQVTTSTIKFGPNRLNGFMQCRSNLTPSACTLCAQIAKETVMTQCPNATTITAWFDGCYLHYYSHHKSSIHIPPYLDTTSYWSCSNQTIVMDLIGHQKQFKAAFEMLVLRLRADMDRVDTGLRFSTGGIQYGSRGSQVLYGLAECVHSVSHKDCDVCIEKGTEKLLEGCGSKDGGTVAAGHCIVRCETHKFF